MFKKLFRPDSPLMITLTNITDCIFLSLFWLIACIPVVTAGAAFAALYDASFRAFRKGERHSWQRFLHVLRSNLKTGIVPTLVVAVLLGVCGWGMIQVWNAAVAGNISWMIFSGAALLAVLAVGILSVVFPMLSRFENSTGVLLRNSLFLAMANLPGTLLLGILNTAVGMLCLWYVFPVFFAPSLAALLGSLLIEPMFRPFLKEEEEET